MSDSGLSEHVKSDKLFHPYMSLRRSVSAEPLRAPGGTQITAIGIHRTCTGVFLVRGLSGAIEASVAETAPSVRVRGACMRPSASVE